MWLECASQSRDAFRQPGRREKYAGAKTLLCTSPRESRISGHLPSRIKTEIDGQGIYLPTHPRWRCLDYSSFTWRFDFSACSARNALCSSSTSALISLSSRFKSSTFHDQHSPPECPTKVRASIFSSHVHIAPRKRLLPYVRTPPAAYGRIVVALPAEA